MVAGMPLSMTIGVGGNAPLPIVTALVLSRNGNAITFSRRFYDEGIRTIADFKALLKAYPDKAHTLGMVHPASMHNLMLRYWLASGGIDPNQDVTLTVIPPPQMVAALKAGQIDGYCVGEPWNSRAVKEGLGYVMATDLDLWPGHPEKVLGVTEEWVNQNPQTHIALVKALLEACDYCDDRRNRPEILEFLIRPEYVGVSPDYISPGFLEAYSSGTTEPPRTLLRYNQFHVDQSNCPARVEGLWILTQLARWGITAFPRNWVEILERVRRVDLYGEAARQLGLPDAEPDRNSITLFDGVVFNPDDPIEYLHKLDIRRDIRVEEILVDSPTAIAA
jgi:nitrate/nitrite transport system ATP-binding protein